MYIHTQYSAVFINASVNLAFIFSVRFDLNSPKRPPKSKDLSHSQRLTNYKFLLCSKSIPVFYTFLKINLWIPRLRSGWSKWSSRRELKDNSLIWNRIPPPPLAPLLLIAVTAVRDASCLCICICKLFHPLIDVVRPRPLCDVPSPPFPHTSHDDDDIPLCDLSLKLAFHLIGPCSVVFHAGFPGRLAYSVFPRGHFGTPKHHTKMTSWRWSSSLIPRNAWEPKRTKCSRPRCLLQTHGFRDLSGR